MVKASEHLTEQRLRDLGLLNLEVFKHMMGEREENGARLFSVVASDRIKDNG